MKIRLNKNIKEQLNTIQDSVLYEEVENNDYLKLKELEICEAIAASIIKENRTNNILATFKFDPTLCNGGMIKNIIFPTIPMQSATILQKDYMPEKFKDIDKVFDVDPIKTIENTTDQSKSCFSSLKNFSVQPKASKSKNQKDEQNNESFVLSNYTYNEYEPINEIYSQINENFKSLNESIVFNIGVGLGSIAGTLVQDIALAGVVTIGTTAIKLAPLLITANAAGRLLTGLTEDHGTYWTDDSKLEKIIDEQQALDEERQPSVAKSKNIVNCINSYLTNLTQSITILLQNFSSQGGKIAEEFTKEVNNLINGAGENIETVLKGLNEFEKELQEIERRKREIKSEVKANNFEQVNTVWKNMFHVDLSKVESITDTTQATLQNIKTTKKPELSSKNINIENYKPLNEALDEKAVIEKTTLDCTEIFIKTKNALTTILSKVFTQDLDSWKDIAEAKKQMETLLKSTDESFKRQIDIICRTGNQDFTKNLGDNIKRFISQHPMRAEGLKQIWSHHYNDLERRIAQRLENMKANDIMLFTRQYLTNTIPQLYAVMIMYLSMAKVLSDDRSITSDVYKIDPDELENKITQQAQFLPTILKGIFQAEGKSNILSSNKKVLYVNGKYNKEADLRYTGLFIQNLINANIGSNANTLPADITKYPEHFSSLCVTFNQHIQSAVSSFDQFIVYFMDLLKLLCPSIFNIIVNINELTTDESIQQELDKKLKIAFSIDEAMSTKIDQLHSSLQKNNGNLIGNLKNNEVIIKLIKLAFSHPEIAKKLDELNKIQFNENTKKDENLKAIKEILNANSETIDDLITPTIDKVVDDIKNINKMFIIPKNADIYSYINMIDSVLKLNVYLKDFGETCIERFLKLSNFVLCEALQEYALQSIDSTDLKFFVNSYNEASDLNTKVNLINDFAIPGFNNIIITDKNKEYITRLLDTKFTNISNEFYNTLVGDNAEKLQNFAEVAKNLASTINIDLSEDKSLNEYIEFIKDKLNDKNNKIKDNATFLNAKSEFKSALSNVYLKIINLKAQEDSNKVEENKIQDELNKLKAAYKNTIDKGILNSSNLYNVLSSENNYSEIFNKIKNIVGNTSDINKTITNAFEKYIENPNDILSENIENKTLFIENTKKPVIIDITTGKETDKVISTIDDIKLTNLMNNEDLSTITDILTSNNEEITKNDNKAKYTLDMLKSTILYLYNMAINNEISNYNNKIDKIKEAYNKIRQDLGHILHAKQILKAKNNKSINNILAIYNNLLNTMNNDINKNIKNQDNDAIEINILSDEYYNKDNYIDYNAFIDKLKSNKINYIEYLKTLYNKLYGTGENEGNNWEVLNKIKNIISPNNA